MKSASALNRSLKASHGVIQSAIFKVVASS
jgi:hypothetical protein